MNKITLQCLDKIYNAVYAKFYKEGYNDELIDSYEDAVNMQSFKEALLDYCTYRNDPLTSDRECAAFYAAYKIMEYAKAFNI